MFEVCGILHGTTLQPHDDDGCLLPRNHEGPHEFVDRYGELWQWETDLSCTCEHCMRCEGDYCTTYWRKADSRGEIEYQSWLAALRTARVPPCATCGGTGVVDDGELTHSEGGIPYENGPIKCVKDCPACKGARGVTEAIPGRVYWAPLADNFYSAEGQGMGLEFYRKWKPRRAEFPQGESAGWGKGSAHNPFKDPPRNAGVAEVLVPSPTIQGYRVDASYFQKWGSIPVALRDRAIALYAYPFGVTEVPRG